MHPLHVSLDIAGAVGPATALDPSSYRHSGGSRDDARQRSLMMRRGLCWVGLGWVGEGEALQGSPSTSVDFFARSWWRRLGAGISCTLPPGARLPTKLRRAEGRGSEKHWRLLVGASTFEMLPCRSRGSNRFIAKVMVAIA